MAAADSRFRDPGCRVAMRRSRRAASRSAASASIAARPPRVPTPRSSTARRRSTRPCDSPRHFSSRVDPFLVGVNFNTSLRLRGRWTSLPCRRRKIRGLIVTPPTFVSLVAPIAHDRPRTFAFRGYDLLVREHDLALPDAAALKHFDLAPANVLPVGLFDKEYCCTAWLPRETPPPEGFAFKGLRALFGRVDEHTLAVAGRALQ